MLLVETDGTVATFEYADRAEGLLLARDVTPNVKVALGVNGAERVMLRYRLGNDVNARATAMTAVITEGSYLQVTGLAVFEFLDGFEHLARQCIEDGFRWHRET
jgi:hypothetical protein